MCCLLFFVDAEGHREELPHQRPIDCVDLMSGVKHFVSRLMMSFYVILLLLQDKIIKHNLMSIIVYSIQMENSYGSKKNNNKPLCVLRFAKYTKTNK